MVVGWTPATRPAGRAAKSGDARRAEVAAGASTCRSAAACPLGVSGDVRRADDGAQLRAAGALDGRAAVACSDEQRVHGRVLRGLRRPASSRSAGADPAARVRLGPGGWPSGASPTPEQVADALAFLAEQEADLAGRPSPRPRRQSAPAPDPDRACGDALPGAVRARTRSCMSIDRVELRRPESDTDGPTARPGSLARQPSGHFLAEQGIEPGLAGAGLAARTRTGCPRADGPPGRRSRPGTARLRPEAEGPAAPAPGQGDDLAVHAGRPEPPRPVRPQARARAAATARRSPATSSSTTPARPARSCSAAPGSSASTATAGWS